MSTQRDRMPLHALRSRKSALSLLAMIVLHAQDARTLQPILIPSIEALHAKVDEVWTNSMSAATLPPGASFVHDMGVLAYGTAIPSTFFSGCAAVTNEGVVMHSLTVVESNDVTRIWTCPGGEVARFPVPSEYNAGEWAIDHFPPPSYLTPSERDARVAEAKLGGRQTLRMRLIPESSVPAYLASIAARASSNSTTPGQNEIGAVSSRLLRGGSEIEVQVKSPTEVGLIGIYKTGELTTHPDWTFQGFAVRMSSPMEIHLPAYPERAYVLFANHLRDTDGDRIPDAYEELVTGTSANSQDTDGDGLDDWSEMSLYRTSGSNADTDGDGVSDFAEVSHDLDPLLNAARLVDRDGDGFSDDMETTLGTDPADFDLAPSAGLSMEFSTREMKMRKFGFQAFAPCGTECSDTPESYYLKSQFIEAGYTRCPEGVTLNHRCEATVEYDRFGAPVVVDGCPQAPATTQYPFYWYRGPNSGTIANTCGATNLTGTLLEADLHYPGQYYREPPLCDSPDKLDYFEFKQMLEKPFSDALLETWTDQSLADLAWPALGEVNQWEPLSDDMPRRKNPSELQFALQNSTAQGDRCGVYSDESLIEHPGSVASHWRTVGRDPGNIEFIAKRTSQMQISAQPPATPPPGVTPSPGIRSLTYLELHAPELSEGVPSSFLVGRRSVLAPDVYHMTEPGRLRRDQREYLPPKTPGQILIISEPITVTPTTPSLIPDRDTYVRALSPLPTAYELSVHDLLLPEDQLGWRSVPDLGVELRQVRGPGGATVEGTNGPYPSSSDPTTGQPRFDLGPAADLTGSQSLFISFPFRGIYVFQVALTGANVGGEKVMARWLVEVVEVTMGVDANRDGVIELPTAGPGPAPTAASADETGPGTPFRFWVNNDADLTERDEGGSDSNPAPDWQDMAINGVRDLEDFMRIHLRFGELSDAIETGQVQVGFRWKSTSGEPSLILYEHTDIEGGTGYLTDFNQGTAIAPTIPPQQSLLSVNGIRRKVDDRTGSFILPYWFWGGVNTATDVRHLLFEASGEGTGAFTMTLHDPNGTWIGDGPQVWLKFLDVKKMYIRSGEDNQFQDPPPDLTDQTIVFIHGWNMSPAEKSYFAETFYKRLWHRGYRGLFAAFMWDTRFSQAEYWAPAVAGNVLEAALANYNDSEFIAWNSAAALKTFVESLPGQHMNLAAHSMGNIVAGEALRLGLVVDNYALMQSAVPAACYDSDEPRIRRTYQYNLYGLATMWDKDTPDGDTDPETRALAYRARFESISQNASLVSYFLQDDYATFAPFEFNNDQYKPEHGALAKYYHYNRSNSPGQKLYKYHLTPVTQLPTGQTVYTETLSYYLESRPYEAMSFACSSWGKALGAQFQARGAITRQVDLANEIYDLPHEDKAGFGDEHSGQFLASIQSVVAFYDRLMRQFGGELTP